MYLEYWMMAILGCMFVAAMKHMYWDGYHKGQGDQIEDAVEIVLTSLAKQNIITIETQNGEKIIKKVLPSKEELDIIISETLEKTLGELDDEQSRTMDNGNGRGCNVHDG